MALYYRLKFHNLLDLKKPYNVMCTLTGMQVKNVQVKIKTSTQQWPRPAFMISSLKLPHSGLSTHK